MVNITLNKTQDVIDYVDGYFDFYICAENLDDVDRKYIKKYDDAVIIDEKLGTIISRYGCTNLKNISTGVKILCLVRHYPDKTIAITEAGNNIMCDILLEADKNGTKLFLRDGYIEFPSGLVVNIDGNTFDDEFEANEYIENHRSI